MGYGGGTSSRSRTDDLLCELVSDSPPSYDAAIGDLTRDAESPS